MIPARPNPAPAEGENDLAEFVDLLFLPDHTLRLLCMFACYFDASGKTSDVTGSGDPAIALAGYIAPAKAWDRFGKDWRRLLHRFGLQYAHQKDFAHSSGQYRGWSEWKRRAYVRKGAEIINQTAHLGVVTAVLLKDWQKIVSEVRGPASAFYFVTVECLKQVALWGEKTGLGEPIRYFFESGDGHDAEVLGIAPKIRTDPDMVDGYRLDSITLADKRDRALGPGLQAADWLAWESAKYLRDTKLTAANPRDMRVSLRLLYEPGKLETRFYNEDGLLKLAESARKEIEERGIVPI